MGIRIHKGLGWKLLDYVSGDERFNQDWFKPFEEMKYEDVKNQLCEYSWSIKDEKHGCSLGGISREGLIRDIYSLIHFDDEYDTDFWVLKSPYDNHHNYDNAVDYEEASLKKDGFENGLVDLPNGFYPWSNSFMLAETGERATNVLSQNGKLYFTDNKYDLYNFLSEKEKRDIFVPNIPDEIKRICEFFKIFKDSKTINQLRPVIYTYWC